MHTIKICCVAMILLGVVSFASAQDQKPNVTVKHVPITKTSATSGKEMFNNYCASCHGKEGKGNGPAAPALKTPPADLTKLPKKDGKFDSAHVAAVIRGQAQTPSHGSEDMPVWGPLFSSISQGHESEVQQRVTNLVTYIETLQAK
jgi:mono/diheme cytochrome c family protein